jgi:uncharacterized protein (DUF1499 family)
VIGSVLLVLIALRLVAAAFWPTINDVRTGGTPEYADLQPQRFSEPPQRVFEAAVASAQSLGWEIAGQDAGTGEIQAVATTRLLRFKDDVTVNVGRDGEATVVNVRSHSRIGKGDLGANARRIRAFQADLEKRL